MAYLFLDGSVEPLKLPVRLGVVLPRVYLLNALPKRDFSNTVDFQPQAPLDDFPRRPIQDVTRHIFVGVQLLSCTRSRVSNIHMV